MPRPRRTLALWPEETALLLECSIDILDVKEWVFTVVYPNRCGEMTVRYWNGDHDDLIVDGAF